jgi:hypothetical protein
MSKLRKMWSATRVGRVAVLVWRSTRKRLSYRSGALALRCSLADDVQMPDAKTLLAVRPLPPTDADVMKPGESDSLQDLYERLLRLNLLNAGRQTCQLRGELPTRVASVAFSARRTWGSVTLPSVKVLPGELTTTRRSGGPSCAVVPAQFLVHAALLAMDEHSRAAV